MFPAAERLPVFSDEQIRSQAQPAPDQYRPQQGDFKDLDHKPATLAYTPKAPDPRVGDGGWAREMAVTLPRLHSQKHFSAPKVGSLTTRAPFGDRLNKAHANRGGFLFGQIEKAARPPLVHGLGCLERIEGAAPGPGQYLPHLETLGPAPLIGSHSPRFAPQLEDTRDYDVRFHDWPQKLTESNGPSDVRLNQCINARHRRLGAMTGKPRVQHNLPISDDLVLRETAHIRAQRFKPRVPLSETFVDWTAGQVAGQLPAGLDQVGKVLTSMPGMTARHSTFHRGNLHRLDLQSMNLKRENRLATTRALSSVSVKQPPPLSGMEHFLNAMNDPCHVEELSGFTGGKSVGDLTPQQKMVRAAAQLDEIERLDISTARRNRLHLKKVAKGLISKKMLSRAMTMSSATNVNVSVVQV